MGLEENLDVDEVVSAQIGARAPLRDEMVIGRAHARFVSRRPKNWVVDKKTGLLVPEVRLVPHRLAGPRVLVPDPDCFDLLLEDESWNLITNVGRVFIHTQVYGTTLASINGLNYIAISNDPVTETSTSTTLSNEITTNGFARAQGVVTLPTGSGTSTIVDHTFTCSGPQSSQKAALFTAVSGGVMNHVLPYAQRPLFPGDTLEITFTLTIS